MDCLGPDSVSAYLQAMASRQEDRIWPSPCSHPSSPLMPGQSEKAQSPNHPSQLPCCLLLKERWTSSMSSSPWPSTSCWSVPATFADGAAAAREIGADKAGRQLPPSSFRLPTRVSLWRAPSWRKGHSPILSFSLFPGSPRDFSNFITSYYCCSFLLLFHFFSKVLFFHLYLLVFISPYCWKGIS